MQMFQTPGLIVMTIAATRMYRVSDFFDLGYYISSILPFCPYADYNRCRSSFNTFWTRRGRAANTDARISFSVPIPLNRVEVTGQDVAYGTDNVESQSMDKSLVLSIGEDSENGVKRG